MLDRSICKDELGHGYLCQAATASQITRLRGIYCYLAYCLASVKRFAVVYQLTNTGPFENKATWGRGSEWTRSECDSNCTPLGVNERQLLGRCGADQSSLRESKFVPIRKHRSTEIIPLCGGVFLCGCADDSCGFNKIRLTNCPASLRLPS